jgi:hypothetical protein
LVVFAEPSEILGDTAIVLSFYVRTIVERTQ